MDDIGVLTTLLNSFVDVFSAGFSRLFPDAMRLLSILALLEITTAAVWWALAEENVTVAVLKKIIQIGFFIFIVSNYQMLIDVVLSGFVETGLRAGGSDSSALMKNPSAIVQRGFIVTKPIFDYINDMGPVDTMANLHNLILIMISGLLILFAFFALAIQVFITYLEFFLVSVLGLILIPFGVFKHTSFMAEKVFGAIISFGIRLMVLAFILTAAFPTLANLNLPADPQFQEAIIIFLKTLTIMGLAWHAPAVAGGLVSGAPSLTAAAGVGIAGAAAAGIAGAGLVGSKVAREAAYAGLSATKAAASTVGAVTSAASLGSAAAGGGALSQAAGAVSGVGTVAGAAVKDGMRSAAGGITDAYARGKMRAVSALGGAGGSSPSPPSSGGGSGSGTAPQWARNLQALRQAVPPDAHPGPGMSAPIQRD